MINEHQAVTMIAEAAAEYFGDEPFQGEAEIQDGIRCEGGLNVIGQYQSATRQIEILWDAAFQDMKVIKK